MGEVACDVPLLENAVLVEGKIPEQRTFGEGLMFPHVLVPDSPHCTTLEALLEGLSTQKLEIEACLHKNGAVLLRGFKVFTPSDFNDVLETLGYEDFRYVGRGAARTVIVGRVSTTNESRPSHLPIGFHNEMAYQVKTPSKIIFYCNVEAPPASRGGATPIVQGHLVYERLSKEMPDFVEQVEKKGLSYQYPLDEEIQGKNSWQTLFQTDDKAEAQKRAKALSIRLEWQADGGAAAFMEPRLGTKVDEAHGRKVWFNTIHAIYELKLISPPGTVGIAYGDGSPLDDETICACKKIMEEEQVAFKWHKGDVLILDNNAVMHAREPFDPPRRILASLCGN